MKTSASWPPTITSGLLVAATTVTPKDSCTPSISFRRLVSTPSFEPPSDDDVEDLDTAKASISSCRTIREVMCFEKEVTYEEDDTRSRSSGLTECFSNGSLGLSDEFIQELK